MKYAITLASFRKIEPIDNTLTVLARQGYDAIEMFGEPSEVDAKKLLDSLNSYGLSVCGVTGMWGSISSDGWKRRLLSSDPMLVQASEQYVIDCLKLCNILGGHEMNVCLFADDMQGVDRTHRIISTNDKELFAAKAVPIMNRLCRKAADYGIQLVLEPLNRYSTPYCATAKDAIALAQQVDSLGILLDTFHMNIEEDSFKDAIQSSRKFLRHMHFADNNRKMPGFAHIDFSTIVKSLNEIGYRGYISFEPNIADRNYEHATKYGLDFVKRIIQHQDK
ncbi:MAG TPA: sugar phosphate isomerase/epimerase family protein [Nitrososphaera sp.]|jgi:sugar phosphate isomerase/epimerase|nr:sugar phosphate isomerase/epimerase family protein [Nitrososphaera sp.]